MSEPVDKPFARNGWLVAHGEGRFVYDVWPSAREAIEGFLVCNFEHTWREWKRHGYRCRRVEIREVPLKFAQLILNILLCTFLNVDILPFDCKLHPGYPSLSNNRKRVNPVKGDI